MTAQIVSINFSSKKRKNRNLLAELSSASIEVLEPNAMYQLIPRHEFPWYIRSFSHEYVMPLYVDRALQYAARRYKIASICLFVGLLYALFISKSFWIPVLSTVPFVYMMLCEIRKWLHEKARIYRESYDPTLRWSTKIIMLDELRQVDMPRGLKNGPLQNLSKIHRIRLQCACLGQDNLLYVEAIEGSKKYLIARW